MRKPFEKGNTYGKGRPKGSRNKKTIERTEARREWCESTGFLDKAYSIMLKKMEHALEDGTEQSLEKVKLSELIKLVDVQNKYHIQTTSQDQDDEVIESLNRSDADQMANRIKQRLEKLTPQALEDEEDE